MATTDAHGTLNPEFRSTDVRFKVLVRGYEPEDIESWQYKLDVYDMKYLDSDSLPIFSIAGGSSWVDAFKRAGEYVEEALNSDRCIF